MTVGYRAIQEERAYHNDLPGGERVAGAYPRDPEAVAQSEGGRGVGPQAGRHAHHHEAAGRPRQETADPGAGAGERPGEGG